MSIGLAGALYLQQWSVEGCCFPDVPQDALLDALLDVLLDVLNWVDDCTYRR